MRGPVFLIPGFLFGAGLVMIATRAEARGTSCRGMWFRRCFWLLVIGALHGYLLWFGDTVSHVNTTFSNCRAAVAARNWHTPENLKLGFIECLHDARFVPITIAIRPSPLWPIGSSGSVGR